MMRSVTAILVLGCVQQSNCNEAATAKSAAALIYRDPREKLVDVLINKLLDRVLVVQRPYLVGSDARALDESGSAHAPAAYQAIGRKNPRHSDVATFQPLDLRPGPSEKLVASTSTSLRQPRLPLSARVSRTLRSSATRENSLTVSNQNASNVLASLFGVGAPEAVVIGVVALTVFGPKGLADVVKQFSSTVRQFQPTIRELQDVSQGFQQTLKDEIMTDEIQDGVRDLQSTLRGDFLAQDYKPLGDKETKSAENIATTAEVPAEATVPAKAQVPRPEFQPSERPANQQKPRLADMSVDMLREELKKKKER